MNIKYAFLLTSLSGLATLLGSFIIFIKTKKIKNFLVGSLSFAAGVMITVSFTDLIPESLNLLNQKYYYLFSNLLCITFIILGIILSSIIDKLYQSNDDDNSKIFKIGIISMISIILHNIPEGIATFMATTSNLKLGLSLTFAIALHNIPEGISIAIPIYYATKSKKKALLYTLISGLSEPFGAMLCHFFLAKYLNNTWLGILFSIIAGIMLHISFYELIPGAAKYQKKRIMYLFFIIGSFLMLLKLFFF